MDRPMAGTSRRVGSTSLIWPSSEGSSRRRATTVKRVERMTRTMLRGVPRETERKSRRVPRPKVSRSVRTGSGTRRWFARRGSTGWDSTTSRSCSVRRAGKRSSGVRRAMAERRTLHRRVEALERQLAPVQQFDSNRPAAASSGSDETWIDRYMAGDRSARAVSTARRAFE